MSGLYVIDFLVASNEGWSDSFRLGSGDPFVPMPLTDKTFAMHIRRDVDATSAALILDADNGRIAVAGDASEGNVSILVPQAEVRRLGLGTFYHDILMFDVAGKPRRIAKGTLEVERGVTRV